MTSGTRRRRASRGDGELLRDQIVASATELLASSGSSEAVSIRKVADAAGVTSPSIYLHFADKWALLEAVCTAVFNQLDAAMLTAAEGLTEPLDVLCAYGLAYVDFAVEHPEHYRLATMETHHDSGEEMGTLDQVLADSAFTHMLDAVVACQRAGVFAEGDPLPAALHLWAAAHGVASLMITKPFLPWGDRRAFAERVLGAAAMGMAVQDLHGGTMTPEQGQAWLSTLPRTHT